jgi:hypothetical protein
MVFPYDIVPRTMETQSLVYPIWDTNYSPGERFQDSQYGICNHAYSSALGLCARLDIKAILLCGDVLFMGMVERAVLFEK